MTGFLEIVTGRKAEEVSRKKKERPASALQQHRSCSEVRDFLGAIVPGAIIAEIKRKSPSVASFRRNGPPEQLASIYEGNGARAISVVTDESNFGTSLADLTRVRSTVSLPVLAKDFIIDEYQVIESWAAGADAVLLIARILKAAELRSFAGLAARLGMCPLVECHDEADLEKTIAAEAAMVGINNRDLGTLEVSIGVTPRLIALLPKGTCCISESGIKDREEVERLLECGVTGFLVGGALLESHDPGRKLRELLGRTGQGE